MKNIFLFIILVIFTLSSCKDFLTEEPKLSQSNELTLSNFNGLDKATLGAYAILCEAGWYGGSFVLSSELRAGNAKNPTNTEFTTGRYTTDPFWNYSSSATSGIFSRAYYIIAQANNIINNLEGKTSSEVSQQDINNIKAECLFLRALGHFDAVRVYAQPFTYAPDSPGMPVVLETITDNKPPRNTVREVYEQVLLDLLEAEEIIADNYVRSGVADRKATVTKPVIQALLSRVYLYMGNWQACADYATKVINNSAYTMWTAAEYLDVWGVDVPTGGEVIFEAYGAIGNYYDPYRDAIAYMTDPDGYPDVISTADLRNLFEAGDIRGQVFRSHPGAPDHFWTAKYPGKGIRNPDVNNTIILRLSEMYLNRAEALYRGATIAGATAVSDLNVITSNRGAATIDTPSQDVIFNERRKELNFEGHIVFDYARTQRSIVRTDYDGVTNKDIPFPSYMWALPIPLHEINANDNMTQNEGYY